MVAFVSFPSDLVTFDDELVQENFDCKDGSTREEEQSLVIMELQTFMPCACCLLLLLHALGNDFYFVSLCLLDIISFSPRLQNVQKAVSRPFEDLIRVFLLYAVVIFVFATWGLYIFGEVIVYEDDGSTH